MILALAVAVRVEAGETKVSGYMFGDYYWIAAHHDAAIEDANGFWFRRIYITLDTPVSEDVSVRFRTEMSSPGDFKSKDKLSPKVKDAYLKTSVGRSKLLVGISPTPTWDLVEHVWGYRSVEKTPADLQKFGHSRDFGVSLKGKAGAGNRIGYHVMLANGAGNGTETNQGKKAMGALTYTQGSAVVQGYADYEELPGHHDRVTVQGFAAYKTERFRAGGQVLYQRRQLGAAGEEGFELLSGFAAGEVGEDLWGYARFDRTVDPNASGAKIAYIPFDPSAASNLFIAGLDWSPRPKVHVEPNVEVVVYDAAPNGTTPDTDVIPRISFFYKF